MNSDLYFRTDAAGMTFVEVSERLLAHLDPTKTEQRESSREAAANLKLDAQGKIRVEEVEAFLTHDTGDVLCDCPEETE